MSLRVDYSVLNQRETPSLFADVFSNRPAFGFNGRLFISIDTKQIFRDYGTNWELIADAGSGSSNLQQVCTNGNFTTTDIDMLSGNLILRNLNPGGVLFTNTSEIVSQDINNFFWDDTNNRLGIGTNTPTAPLDVHSTGNILQQLNGTSTNNTYLAFLNQDIGKWRIGNYYNSGDNDFVIYDTNSGVTRAFFTNTGYTIFPTNMIIGSSNRSSAYGMDVYVSANYQSTLRVQGASTFLSQINGNNAVFTNTINAGIITGDSNSTGVPSIVAKVGSGGNNGTFGFGNDSNYRIRGGSDYASMNFDTAGVERMKIGNDGTKYFGNASLSRFQMNTAGENFYQYTNSYYIWGLYNDANNLAIESLFSGGISFKTAAQGISSVPTTGTTRLLITSGGNLLIGTIIDNGSKLQISGETRSTSYSTSGNSKISENSGSVPAATPTTIFTNFTTNGGSFVLVTGRTAAGDWFFDTVVVNNDNSASALSSQNGGGPPARIYTVSTNNLRLTVATALSSFFCFGLSAKYS